MIGLIERISLVILIISSTAMPTTQHEIACAITVALSGAVYCLPAIIDYVINR